MDNENIKVTVEELRKLINIDNFIGEPIETEDKLLVPVMRMGFGFGTGQNILGNEGNDIVGAGAGVEPVSMVIIPKSGTSGEGIRVVNLTGGSEVNKALNEFGLIISDLINDYLIKPNKEDDEYDESEYIEPNFSEKEE